MTTLLGAAAKTGDRLGPEVLKDAIDASPPELKIPIEIKGKVSKRAVGDCVDPGGGQSLGFGNTYRFTL